MENEKEEGNIPVKIGFIIFLLTKRHSGKGGPGAGDPLPDPPPGGIDRMNPVAFLEYLDPVSHVLVGGAWPGTPGGWPAGMLPRPHALEEKGRGQCG
jgi:hypothetical protein